MLEEFLNKFLKLDYDLNNWKILVIKEITGTKVDVLYCVYVSPNNSLEVSTKQG